MKAGERHLWSWPPLSMPHVTPLLERRSSKTSGPCWKAEPTEEELDLFEEFDALVHAPGNEEILEAFEAAFSEAGPPTDAIIGFVALVQASGDPALQAGFVEFIDAILASAGPLPEEALSQAAAVVQASGNLEVGERFQDFLEAAAKGEGGGKALVELTASVQASGDPAIQRVIFRNIGAVLGEADPPEEAFEQFIALIEASGNEEVLQAFYGLGGPPPEFIEELRPKVAAVGDPALEALFEETLQSVPPQFDVFWEGLIDALRETLSGEPGQE